jgi:diguanylate cyclase (GGDEF)-like protein/PAS domain S-box-containing protein
MLEAIGDMILRYDAKSRRIYASPSYANGLGYSPDEMLTLHPKDLIHPDDIPLAEAHFRRLGPAYPKIQITMRLRRKDGTYIWVENRYYHLPADDGAMVITRDITASKLAEEALASSNGRLEAANVLLRQQAQFDALTNLANRRLFEERLMEEHDTAFRDAAPLGLIMFDVDYFKAYNDRYGHQAGDEALRRVSRSLQHALRSSRELAARYGGEEIVVMLPGCDVHAAFIMAERMREAVMALSIEHLGSPLGCLTISGGASAMIPRHEQSRTFDLIAAADRALYAAKAEGRNRVRAGEVEVVAPTDARPRTEWARLIPTPSQPKLAV